MAQINDIAAAPSPALVGRSAGALLRGLVIGLVAFLTVVDLFAAQAILPSLVTAYGVSPAAMGFAVNASTIGMAAAGLGVALFGRRIERRGAIILCLALLSIPTALLAVAPDLAWFTALRVVQGLFMSAAFTLTLAYLAENCSATDAASAFAAYITGNVASNLVGRLVSAGVADHLGLAANFYVFALLNLSGAILVYVALQKTQPMTATAAGVDRTMAGWLTHLRSAPLRAGFATGFCILFAFIGTFTYVNFVLVAEPLLVSPMAIGLVYVVFLPAIVTTPLAGRVVRRWGTRPSVLGAFAVAITGLPLVLSSQLPLVMIGLALIGVGTFFAQAIATGFVSRAAAQDRAAASGIYLASYFLGGMVGSAVIGHIFVQLGWTAAVIGIGIALLVPALLAGKLQVAAERQSV